MTEEQPQLALELPEIPRRAPRRATSAQSAPNVKALDQLVDLTGAVANHSERVAGAATKRTAGGRSRRAKSADQAADLTEAGTAPGAAPAPGGDGGGEPGASGSDGAGGQTARK
ncbi:MAG: hypothetical protein LBG60_06485, partial [Bifidobacteriaceae bacterium]|nr:hypothetical protein [Bifidobacteriaceae bacterium]